MNPSWKINNRTDYHTAGLASIKLMGPSFTVIDIRWSMVRSRRLMVECETEECRVVARLTRPGSTTTTSPSTTTSTTTTRTTRRTTTTATTPRTTTRPR